MRLRGGPPSAVRGLVSYYSASLLPHKTLAFRTLGGVLTLWLEIVEFLFYDRSAVVTIVIKF